MAKMKRSQTERDLNKVTRWEKVEHICCAMRAQCSVQKKKIYEIVLEVSVYAKKKHKCEYSDF